MANYDGRKKEVIGIIGAGISGLLACKYCLSKGFDPIVFEWESSLGGVWTKTIGSTKLQTPKPVYQFSDFPWPDSVTQVFPDQQTVLEYIESYAIHFDLVRHIHFNSKVLSLRYEDDRPGGEWNLWGGTGEAFSNKGKWNITVQDTRAISTQTQRWAFSKYIESYIKHKNRLAKHGMVPEHSFLNELSSCSVSLVPDGFYDRVEEGSIKLIKKAEIFGFSKEGMVLEGQAEPIKSEVVILATGFKGIDKLKHIFESPKYQEFIAGSDDSAAVPLYRECIHPRIPQVAIVGFSESVSSLHTSEIRCRWLAELLDGKFKLPSINVMEKDIGEWDKYKKRYSYKKYYRRSCIGALHIWYNDQLCNDMGWNPKRKKGLWAEWFEPYGPLDYAA